MLALLHDSNNPCTAWFDIAVSAIGVRVLRTPVRAPKANAVCERLLGGLRRGCTDFLIPLGEEPLRRTLCASRLHYNRGRPHLRLGSRLLAPGKILPAASSKDHRLQPDTQVVARLILGGLHHEYDREKLGETSP